MAGFNPFTPFPNAHQNNNYNNSTQPHPTHQNNQRQPINHNPNNTPTSTNNTNNMYPNLTIPQSTQKEKTDYAKLANLYFPKEYNSRYDNKDTLSMSFSNFANLLSKKSVNNAEIANVFHSWVMKHGQDKTCKKIEQIESYFDRIGQDETTISGAEAKNAWVIFNKVKNDTSKENTAENLSKEQIHTIKYIETVLKGTGTTEGSEIKGVENVPWVGIKGSLSKYFEYKCSNDPRFQDKDPYLPDLKTRRDNIFKDLFDLRDQICPKIRIRDDSLKNEKDLNKLIERFSTLKNYDENYNKGRLAHKFEEIEENRRKLVNREIKIYESVVELAEKVFEKAKDLNIDLISALGKIKKNHEYAGRSYAEAAFSAIEEYLKLYTTQPSIQNPTILPYNKPKNCNKLLKLAYNLSDDQLHELKKLQKETFKKGSRIGFDLIGEIPEKRMVRKAYEAWNMGHLGDDFLAIEFNIRGDRFNPSGESIQNRQRFDKYKDKPLLEAAKLIANELINENPGNPMAGFPRNNNPSTKEFYDRIGNKKTITFDMDNDYDLVQILCLRKQLELYYKGELTLLN